MSHEVFQKGAPIMKQGDESNDKLYVIINGKVGIVIAKDTNIFRKAIKLDRNESHQTPEEDQVDIQTVIQLYGTKVNELTKGDGFGEKALLLKPQDAKRNATIIALEKTDCITVLRKDFLHILENFNKETQMKEQLLIQLMPFLKTITSTSTKEALMLYFKNQSASRGKYLTQEGKLGEYVYILQTGKVSVEKKFLNSGNIYYQDYQTVKLTEISEPTILGEEILFIDSDVQDQLKNLNQQNKGSSSQENGDEILVTENDEYIQENYKYTIKVESLLCKFLMIQKEFFLNKFPKEILSQIKQQYLLKEQARLNVYNIMRNHKQAFQHHGQDQIDETLHRMNEISNKEIFYQMKPQMIESYNKVQLKKQCQPQTKSPQITKYNEEISKNLRSNIDQKFEDIEKKKVLLRQKFDSVMTKRKEIRQLLNCDHNAPPQAKNNSNKSIENGSPLVSPRLQSNNSSRRNSFKSPNQNKDDISHRNGSAPRQSPTQSPENSMLVTALDKLKQHRNIDGSLNTVELMQKVKYKKIQIEDISVADIMGDDFNIFDNQEANRLITIKSDQPQEKQKLLDKLKEDEEKKKFDAILQKIQKGEVQDLDLGYLHSFKKQQHFKLVQLGKKKIETPKSKGGASDSLKLNQDIKEKILSMKNKDREQLEQDTQNLISNVSYLTPSSQTTKALQSQFYSGDVSKLDYFSDYVDNIKLPLNSHRQISSACSQRKKQSFTPSMSVRSSLSSAHPNFHLDETKYNAQNSSNQNQQNLNLGIHSFPINNNAIKSYHSQQNTPIHKKNNNSVSYHDISTINNQSNNPALRLKTAQTPTTVNQWQLSDKKPSRFSRDLKSKSCMRIQTKHNINTQQSIAAEQTSQNKIDELPFFSILKLEGKTNNFLLGDLTLDNHIQLDNCSINSQNLRLNTNIKTSEEIESAVISSPIPLRPHSSFGSGFKLNFEKKDILQFDSSTHLQPQVMHTKQFSCLTQIGQAAAQQQSTSSYFNREKTQVGTQSPLFIGQHKITSPQSSKFKFNDFLALKQKQRQQLCLNRDSKVKKSLNTIPNTASANFQNIQSQQNNKDFVFNNFLK